MSSIKEVCELAKVSKSTVSRVLNNHPSVSEETREKVLKVITQLDYRPNASAQALASNRSNCIGMLVETIAGPFYSYLVSTAEQIVRQEKLYLIATSGQESWDREVDSIMFFKSKQVDGLILHSGELSDYDILEIVKEIPATVLLNHSIPEIAENCICLDDELGGYLATQHLLENGHTRIGCITGPLRSRDSRERLLGYRKALAEYDIEYDAKLVVEGNFCMANNDIAPNRLLDRNTDMTAIFCQNDHIALGVYDVLKQRGITIGDDISVVGFDNSIFSAHTDPKLTTINFPVKEMGIEAAKKVLSLIKNMDYSMPQKLIPELVIRDSVRKVNR
ncbi:LacI family DNA-binding transcriptional regulator [Vibrio sp. WJH972]